MTRTPCLLLLLILLPFFTVYGQGQGQQLRELEAMVVINSGAIPVFTEHPTMAVISVRSNLSNLRFVSTLDIVHEYNDPAAGVYTLIVPPSRQSIRISAPGYMELAITVPLTEPRQVLYYEVRERAVSTTQQSVVFRVEPKDARLSIDGVDYGTPSEPVRVATGTRQVRLERTGYTPLQTQIEVNATTVFFEYTLVRIDPVAVEVRTVPAGVRVSIDGAELGETDPQGIRQFFRLPGRYELEVSLNGYLSQRREIEVSKDSQNRFEFSLERNTGTLRVQVNPADARVEINRQPVGIGQTIELPPGPHRVEVSRVGFATQTDDVTITRGEVLQRRYELVAHTGRLQYTVSPSFAQTVLIDQSGREVDRWTGIKVLNDLKVGIYTLRVTATGYDDQSKPIQIRKDQLEEVMVTLTQQSTRLETSLQPPSPSVGRDTQTAVVDVRNPVTGRTWMDRNLGATRAATSSTDSQAYGDLYQWGRRADGHEKRNSSTTTTLSNTDSPAHGSFILAPNSPYDWRTAQNNTLWQGVNGVNNPCPVGYRIPTDAEWTAERQSWSSQNATGAFNSSLKLPVAGRRSDSNGLIFDVGTSGHYWSSSFNGSDVQRLYFDSSIAEVGVGNRALGRSVRCIKDAIETVSPSMQTTSVSSITANSAISGGNVTNDGGATVTARGLVWSTSQNPTVSSNSGITTSGSGTGNFTSNLIGLSAGTRYYVRAFATNSAGTSYGNQIEFTTTTVSTNLPTYLPINGLIGWWDFKSNTLDLSGLSNNGVIKGSVSLTSDRFNNSNNAYSFPGNANSHIQIQMRAGFSEIRDGFTVSMWFYNDKLDAAPQRMLQIGNTDGGGKGLIMSIHQRKIVAKIYSGQGTSQAHFGSWPTEVPYNSGTWVNLVFASNFRDGEWKLYINGNLMESGLTQNPTGFNPLNLSDRQFYIGMKPGGIGADGWNGKLDDIGIWSRALNLNEVQSLFNNFQNASSLTGRDTETQVVDVRNPATGRTWMDRNLGASRAATSSTDSQAYGDLYQWGRRADGHQKRNSSTISTLSSTNTPAHGSFILAPNYPYDWRSPQNNTLWQGVNGLNNPCPVGYRIPTDAEWTAERQSWSSQSANGAFNSTLKLPVAGYRFSNTGSLYPVGTRGYYWSSTVDGIYSRSLSFYSGYAYTSYYYRAFGFTVRCTKD